MASNIEAMAFNQVEMASNLIAHYIRPFFLIFSGKPADRLGWSWDGANEVSIGVVGGWVQEVQFRRPNTEPGGESEKDCGQNGIEHVWFLGCCDASDVIDCHECIISIMRGSGGWDFMSTIGKDNGHEKVIGLRLWRALNSAQLGVTRRCVSLKRLSSCGNDVICEGRRGEQNAVGKGLQEML